jgi:hypothetical protein
MSAEEMRNELETFVNRGLSEGWGGWPTKGFSPCRADLSVASYATPTAMTQIGVRQNALAHDRGPAWLTRRTRLESLFQDAALGRRDLS